MVPRKRLVAQTQTAARLKTLNPEGTVFAEFTALANEHKAVNLGQVRKTSLAAFALPF